MARLPQLIPVDCPYCGCNQAEVVGASERFGQYSIGCQCTHCMKIFSPLNHPANTYKRNGSAEYVTTRCPHCNSRNNTVTKTINETDFLVKRIHACRNCGRNFKSLEDTRKR